MLKFSDGCDIGIRQRDDKAIELYYRDEWKSVCDKNWSENDAKVACRGLGYSPEGNGYYGMSSVSSSAYIRINLFVC